MYTNFAFFLLLSLDNQNKVRHRKNSEKDYPDTTNSKKKPDNNNKSNEKFTKKLLFKIQPGDSIQTDFR